MTSIAKTLAAASLSLLLAGPALAASCQKEGSFDAWLQGVKKEALADGIPAAAVNAGLSAAHFDQSVVNKDRAQQVFAQTFLEFSGRMVESYRVKLGPSKIATNKAIFAKVEKQFGVPPQVITAFWGLETDFGANMGDGPTLSSLATLAYDCRRPDLFRPQLIDALKIIARGDLTPAQMRGPWAGEMGQFQFLASHYYDYGVDEDGDGKINLIIERRLILGRCGAGILAGRPCRVCGGRLKRGRGGHTGAKDERGDPEANRHERLLSRAVVPRTEP